MQSLLYKHHIDGRPVMFRVSFEGSSEGEIELRGAEAESIDVASLSGMGPAIETWVAGLDARFRAQIEGDEELRERIGAKCLAVLRLGKLGA